MRHLFLALIALCPLWAFSQTTVTGNITTENGDPIQGVAVGILDSYLGTFTKSDGSFKLTGMSKGEHTLFFRFLGYSEDSLTISVTQNTHNISTPIVLREAAFISDEIVINATRASENTPMAENTLSEEDIAEQNLGQDMPYLLRLTPSVVTTSDAGAGVGYTGIRLRGSDASRINVTVNGIPINDAESQGVYWVNMSDLASSTNSIQVQRGVGSSTNGAGAFGGSINVQTNQTKQDPFGEINMGYGSFNTQRYNAKLGTGITKNNYTFEARASRITSDGYIDRATSDLKSYYLAAGHTTKKSSIKLISFGGHEKTYQAWGGVPTSFLDNNRTYNPYTYENQIDNYQQYHYQLLTSFQLSKNLSATVNGHYTRGLGFYENYEFGEQMSSYGINPIITNFDSTITQDTIIGTDTIRLDKQITKSDTIKTTDLINRLWLDNHFYGVVYSLNWSPSSKYKATLGGGLNQYLGGHYGTIQWARYANNTEIGDRFYDNKAIKNDVNVYFRNTWQFKQRWHWFGDLQFRNIYYDFNGINNNGAPLRQNASLNFLNPKTGLTYRPGASWKLYGSFAVGNREPNRNDYTENPNNQIPEPETMYDYELGAEWNKQKIAIKLNGYYMDYFNQLVVTGELNNVGSAQRVNIRDSYRAGVEFQAAYKPIKYVTLEGNATFSQNKAQSFTEYVKNWTTEEQVAIQHTNTDLAFSPNTIATGIATFHLLPNQKGGWLDLQYIAKHVGKQYLDNTQNENRKLAAYTVQNIRLDWKIKNSLIPELRLQAQVENLFNANYVSNGWVLPFQSPGYDPRSENPFANLEQGDQYNLIGNYPNAGRNYLLTLKIGF